jgi:hypothetical protein
MRLRAFLFTGWFFIPSGRHASGECQSGAVQANPEIRRSDFKFTTDLIGVHLLHDTQHKRISLTAGQVVQAPPNNIPELF